MFILENLLMISSAFAQSTSAAQDPLLSFLPLILMFVVLYFLMIRPQMKRAKEHKSLVENLQKNDEVVTTSGVVGKIFQVNNNYITLEIGSGEKNLQVLVQRQAVQTLLPKGTIKEIS
jgi:preprotein translocase subunit YajC